MPALMACLRTPSSASGEFGTAVIASGRVAMASWISLVCFSGLASSAPCIEAWTPVCLAYCYDLPTSGGTTAKYDPAPRLGALTVRRSELRLWSRWSPLTAIRRGSQEALDVGGVDVSQLRAAKEDVG